MRLILSFHKSRKLQHNSYCLAIRVTDEGSLPEIAQYGPYFLPLNVASCFQRIFSFILLFTRDMVRDQWRHRVRVFLQAVYECKYLDSGR